MVFLQWSGDRRHPGSDARRHSPRVVEDRCHYSQPSALPQKEGHPMRSAHGPAAGPWPQPPTLTPATSPFTHSLPSSSCRTTSHSTSQSGSAGGTTARPALRQGEWPSSERGAGRSNRSRCNRSTHTAGLSALQQRRGSRACRNRSE